MGVEASNPTVTSEYFDVEYLDGRAWIMVGHALTEEDAKKRKTRWADEGWKVRLVRVTVSKEYLPEQEG